ncbi:MAG: acetyltransferase [Pseudomonas sp.]|jgi:ribosomal-protein-alanine N-acetyltransferase|uniref:GNAT family N-acetyltransferase n=1 Tax=Pseudomonas sp. TaxID=306 RepID=UPI00260BA7C2|nr:GNAT family N-acetyltransferase [Pseudomonas sp.]MDB6051328.1 acetyltransferase [Pseudomonas sp.]
MDATPMLYTERLTLSPLQLADAVAIQQLFAHWEVVRYLDSRVPWPYPEDGAFCYVHDVALPAIARGEEWHWMIRLTENPAQIIGSISLADRPGNHRGFWLSPAWQGRGFMKEACVTVNRYWFETLKRPLMQVPKAVANEASRRVSRRERMRLISSVEASFVSGDMLRETWELTREEWMRDTL